MSVHDQHAPDEFLPPAYRTIGIRETHTIGGYGTPVSHAVEETIVAEEPIRSVRYYFAGTSNIEHILGEQGSHMTGCRAVPDSSRYVADLALDPPLDAGEETTIEYLTGFDYRSPSQPMYRRRVGASVMSRLDITVQFSRDCRPEHVWRALWHDASPDSPIVPGSIVEAELRNAAALPGFLETGLSERDVQPGVILGYLWEWPAK